MKLFATSAFCFLVLTTIPSAGDILITGTESSECLGAFDPACDNPEYFDPIHVAATWTFNNLDPGRNYAITYPSDAPNIGTEVFTYAYGAGNYIAVFAPDGTLLGGPETIGRQQTTSVIRLKRRLGPSSTQAKSFIRATR